MSSKSVGRKTGEKYKFLSVENNTFSSYYRILMAWG